MPISNLNCTMWVSHIRSGNALSQDVIYRESGTYIQWESNLPLMKCYVSKIFIIMKVGVIVRLCIKLIRYWFVQTLYRMGVTFIKVEFGNFHYPYFIDGYYFELFELLISWSHYEVTLPPLLLLLFKRTIQIRSQSKYSFSFTGLGVLSQSHHKANKNMIVFYCFVHRFLQIIW